MRSLLFLLLASSLSVYASNTVMNLELLADAQTSGAVCLDGSPGGYYFSAATDPAYANSWQIYFQGGGWCYEEADCWKRSQTNLGSSKHWPATIELNGLVSGDCSVNPEFCKYNRVHLTYCDGNSFSGDNATATVFNGTPLYFRGKRIIESAIKQLTANHGLQNAENVMLTGCSAGGLAVYLHTNFVRSLLPDTVKVYKAASISGFFLDHPNVFNEPVYQQQMQYIHQLSNASAGLDPTCVSSFDADNQWRCNFAQYSYQFIKYPIFILNSAFDAWQIPCILSSEPVPHNSTDNGACGVASGWSSCASWGKGYAACTDAQIGAINSYGSQLVDIVQGSLNAHQPYNGGFIHSCATHCEAQSDNEFDTFAIDGVTMRDAVTQWWRYDATQPADTASQSTFFHWPCMLKDGASHTCNPTCGVGA